MDPPLSHVAYAGVREGASNKARERSCCLANGFGAAGSLESWGFSLFPPARHSNNDTAAALVSKNLPTDAAESVDSYVDGHGERRGWVVFGGR